MTVESVTQAVSNLALQFGEEDADPGAMVGQGVIEFVSMLYQNGSQLNPLFFSYVYCQSRPFGVALLFGGVDEKGPQLYDLNIW